MPTSVRVMPLPDQDSRVSVYCWDWWGKGVMLFLFRIPVAVKHISEIGVCVWGGGGGRGGYSE